MSDLSNFNKIQAIIREKKSNNIILAIISFLFVFVLLFSSYLYPNISYTIKAKILDYSSNIVNAIYSPIGTINKSFTNLNNIINVYNINHDLTKENENLKNITNNIIILEAENQELKKLLKLSNDINYKYITAKIISKMNLSYIQSVILMVGKKDSISLGSPVLYNNSLLGYINEIGFNSSRVLSITDINVKIPSVILDKDIKIILSGSNSKFLEILNYVDMSVLKAGDKVFTSGDGNMYPAGLFVGTVRKKLDGNIIIEPSIKLNDLNYVQVINWTPKERGIDINIDPIFYE